MPKILNNPIIISGGGGNLAKAMAGSLNSENYSLTAGDMSGVTKIGDYKFAYDTKLTAIDLSNVTEIGKNAFSATTNLESLDLSNVDVIGEIIMGSSQVKSVTLKNANITIGNQALSSCPLENLVIPDLIQTLPFSFASYCYSMKTLTIGKGVTETGNNAFAYLTGLENLYYNVEDLEFVGSSKSSSASIFNRLGREVTNGTHLHIGDNVKKLPYNFLASTDGAKISQITWGTQNKLTKICGRAFYHVTHSNTISLPEGLLEIEENGFYYCYAPSIEVPSTITILGNNTFGSSYATYVKIKATTPPTIGTTIFNGNTRLTNIQVPAASLISYLGVANLATYVSKIIGYQTVVLNDDYPAYHDGVNYTQTRWYSTPADAIADTDGTGGYASGTVCYSAGEKYCKLFA